MNILKTVNDLAEYLEYEMENNGDPVEISPDLVKELGKPPAAGQSGKHSADGRKKLPVRNSKLIDPITTEINSCRKCSLCGTRINTVPGQGSLSPDIMFIGEAPGADEDQQGKAFVGRAGQLLTKMIQAMGYTREEVFIGNILKCRPPDNRKPTPEEIETCLPYLKRQIAVLKPKVIVALGSTAVQGLLNISIGITKFRGTWSTFENIQLMPTYHPAYLLRNPPAKKEVWEDLQAVLAHLGRTPPLKRDAGK